MRRLKAALAGFCQAALLFAGTWAPAYAATVKIIHDFADQPDGSGPVTDLTPLGSILYGTTLYGGSAGEGSIFSVDANNKVRTIYSFHGSDGTSPAGALTAIGTTLYGTASGGGTNGSGVVFSLTADGQEHVLYNFTRKADGGYPIAGLLAVDGKLYGTTAAGGSPACNGGGGCGVVFSITPSGAYSVVANFALNKGWFSAASLTRLGNRLYGTTESGGNHNGGTVFSMPIGGGNLRPVYQFTGGADGGEPAAKLLVLKGMLYGTTVSGGSQGGGTAFSLTPNGTETVLHSFAGGNGDGDQPRGVLVEFKNRLYGTTSGGGVGDLGTVFAVTLSGKESVWSLGGMSTAVAPDAGLIVAGQALYGTSINGGLTNCLGFGCGTVFSFAP